jgi:hypothetical protein
MIRSPQPLRTRVSAGAAVLLALATLAATAACQGRKPNNIPTSAPTSASPSPSGNAVQAQETAKLLQVYDDFNKELVTLQTTSDVTAARTELPKYTVDPLRTALLLDLQQRQSAGLHSTGQPVWTAKVTEINVAKSPFTATIESCYDATNYQLVNAKGQPAGVTGQAKKYVVTATAEVYGDGKWYLQNSQADRQRPC